MRTITVTLMIALGLTASGIGGSVALATHGGDHCSLEQHHALIQQGYNNKQEADICDGRNLDPSKDYSTDTDKFLDMLLGKRERRVTCQTQYGQCPLNNGVEGQGCSCMGWDGRQYPGFVRGVY
jgi:hypothetical protein